MKILYGGLLEWKPWLFNFYYTSVNVYMLTSMGVKKIVFKKYKCETHIKSFKNQKRILLSCQKVRDYCLVACNYMSFFLPSILFQTTI